MMVLQRRGNVVFAADGIEYVVLVNGVEVYRDMHKGRAEAKARELAERT